MKENVVMNDVKSNRFAFIDAVRGIAALCVMMQHGLEVSGIESLSHASFGLKWFNLGELGVVAFFLVSGFIIPFSLEKSGSIGQFWISRCFRIYPLYVSVYITMIFLCGHFESCIGLIQNALAHISFAQDYFGLSNYVGGSWTLSLELLWYLSCSALFAMGLNEKWKLIFSIAIIGGLVLCLITVFGGIRIPMGRVSLLIACVVGFVFFHFSQCRLSAGAFRLLMILAICIIAANLVVGFYINPSKGFGAPSFTCVFLSWSAGFGLFVIAYFTRFCLVWQTTVFCFLGKISYSVYLMHAVMLLVLTRFGMHGFLFLFALILSTVSISFLTYRFIESPAIALAHRVYHK